MKKPIGTIACIIILLMASLQPQAQVVDVSVINTGNNNMQIIGVPTAPGFSASPNTAWTSMNLSWRIPKTAALPAPTVAPPAATPEVTTEATDFAGAAPRNVFDGQMDLTIFDLTSFGLPDDNYWYFQATGTNESVQSLSTGSTTVLYSFNLPVNWSCPACVEILTSDIPGLPISTTSFIDNAGMGIDVLNLAQNNAPLPVHFIRFYAREEQQQVQLNWRVSNEESIRGYYVERSGDGTNYTKLGFVAPKAAAAFNDYAFTDASPLDNIDYYRIREEDIDGRAMYSEVRIIRRQQSGFIVSLYPVPVKDLLTLKMEANAGERAGIRITDILGRTLYQRLIELNAGTNIQEIPVHGFVNGMYFIEVAGSEHHWAGKFVKE